MNRYFLLFLLFLIYGSNVKAQVTCTALGQNPQTAFPVCGTSVFTQSSVAICGDRPLVSRCSSGTITFTDKNPYWYKFTCFVSGTLGFVITPNNLNDDYDWQLYDITGRDPVSIYTDVSLFVACNWSGDPGITGASPAGTSLIRCEGPGVPLFSAMPTIVQGREYLLLVSHFTDSQSGYTLSFGGGTGSITDPTEPNLLNASAACDGTVIRVKLNKKMKCSTLAANGSDFTLNSPLSSVISATGIDCNTGFDTDSIQLTLNNPLPPGNYTLSIQNGSDGNTLLDNCDRSIAAGSNVSLIVFPIQPTPMDSLVTPGCAPQTLELVFRKPIRSNSIASNGSDFTVTGSYPVTVVSANGDCNNGLTSKIFVQLNAPLQRAGNFIIRLVSGNDGNTIIDECGQETPAGATLNFIIKDTVNADFRSQILLGCLEDTVRYFHNGNNGVNSWQWTFDNQSMSTVQNPVVFYTVFGTKETSLIVSNGTCSDTSLATVFLRNTLKAGFTGTELVCPTDNATFRDTSIGTIRNWWWDFGNGNSSTIKNPPPQTYLSTSGSNFTVPVQLIVENDIGCKDTAVGNVLVIWNCFIAVPSAFTPNGDGLNDYLYPVNAFKATNLQFSVYNRLGQRVFYTENFTRRWNGKFNGQDADPGTYVWILSYIQSDTGKKVFQKGTTVLLR